ncbi:DUF6193 family natural product biosynthesis protein [Streptomyces sp. NPDC006512]|uniref:DUF6193 family natural product biosynthesis protein n=1 Tax=Streptomyces sp. NPDC006512 TaxID=3154307 RepID=UPI0033A342EA
MNENVDAPVGERPLLPRPVLPDAAAARRRGPAEFVEVSWQRLLLSWRAMRDHQLERRPDRPYPPIVPLLEAAYAQPSLRVLHPFTSHHSLNLSSCTEFPYLVQVPAVDPLPDGRFRVRLPRSAGVIALVDTAEEAVALVVEHMPPGLGPAVSRADVQDG